MRGVGQGDQRLHMAQFGQQVPDQPGLRDVEAQNLGLGMVDDIADLFGIKPGVHRMQHGPHARNGEIQLQMPMRVPGQRCHPVTRLDAQPDQGLRDLACTNGKASPGLAHQRTFAGAADDLGRGVILLCVVEQAGNEQGAILHQAEHHGILPRTAEPSPAAAVV